MTNAQRIADKVKQVWHDHGREAAAQVIADHHVDSDIAEIIEILRSTTVTSLHEPVINTAMWMGRADGVLVKDVV